LANEARQAVESLHQSLGDSFQQEQVDEDSLVEEILAVILILYLLGAGYEDESELTDEDRKKLEETYQLTLAAASGMVDRHERGVDMQPTIDRIINHVQGIFPTEHCVDCLEQAGKGEMPGSHWQEMAENEIYPKSPALFCTGLHCQCELTEA
jgi:hypothetical protein